MKLITLLGVLLLSVPAEAGNKAHGGDPLKLAYASARNRAVAYLGSFDFRSSQHKEILYREAAEETARWLENNHERLKLDVAGSKHCRKEECGPALQAGDFEHLNRWCAYTTTSSGSDIVLLDSPQCMETARDAKLATALLYHESAHHLGIEDEDFADAIAQAVMSVAQAIYVQTPQAVSGTGLGMYEATQTWKSLPDAAVLSEYYQHGTEPVRVGDSLVRVVVRRDGQMEALSYNSVTSDVRKEKITLQDYTYVPNWDFLNGLRPTGGEDGRWLNAGAKPVAVGSQILVFGGSHPTHYSSFENTQGYPGAFNHGLIVDLEKKQARKMTLANAPCERFMMPTVATDDGFAIWGGMRMFFENRPSLIPCEVVSRSSNGLVDGRFYVAGTAEKNFKDEKWISISTVDAPSERFNPSLVWTGSTGVFPNRLIVWGGNSWTQRKELNDGAIYDRKTERWTPMSLVGAPSPREGAKTIWTGSEMIVLGGRARQKEVNNGAIYNPVTNSWRPLPLVMGPWELSSAEWTGDRLVVWGSALTLPDFEVRGAFFDPKSNVWTAIRHHAAENCDNEKAFWLGAELFVWNEKYRQQSVCTRVLSP